MNTFYFQISTDCLCLYLLCDDDYYYYYVCSCNRYDARKKADEMLEDRKAEIVKEADKLEEIGRFLHYYERYKEHIKSLSVS